MTHPLIPKILELAIPVATSLGLEVVTAVFQTNQAPPILRVDVRNLHQDTGLDDCERMSHALESLLDQENLIDFPYVLEISSPGVSQFLTHDRDFISFKGFPVAIFAKQIYAGHTEWQGRLVQRDETSVYVNQKGKVIKIPREVIDRVQLIDA